MRKKYVLAWILVVIFLITISVVTFFVIKYSQNPIVLTEYGFVEGDTYYNKHLNIRFFEFKGIPYAEPPINELRFKAPVKPKEWTIIRNAQEHGPNCEVSEDCLFLNVYTPSHFKINRPVMVYIHGGRFMSGSGDDSFLGPSYFINEGVIVVTLNYRLGAFGFLSTGDGVIQGNNGLKDQLMALKWVNKNIGAFGGDVKSITIFGESAGAASVEYLILNPLAKGLFARAISESGSVLCPWALRTDPKNIANQLAENLGLNTTNSEEFLIGILNKTREEIIEAYPAANLVKGLTFAPVIESSDSKEPIYLSSSPYDILKSGNFNKVYYMSGFNDNEALLYLGAEGSSNPIINSLWKDPSDVVPPIWKVVPDSIEAKEMVKQIFDYYNKGNEIIENLSKLATDMEFVFPIDLSVRYHALQQNKPVYYYTFMYDGVLNFGKEFSGGGMYEGAVHTDELYYMWDNEHTREIELTDKDPANVLRNRMVRLWTNFAKYGNPTFVEDEFIDIYWKPVSGNQEFLGLDSNIVPGNHSFAERINFWQGLYDKYAFK